MEVKPGYKQTEIGVIPEDWEICTLANILKFTTGKLNSEQSTEDGKYPFFTCSQETARIDRYSFDQEALLLSGNNAMGKYSIKYYNGKFNAYQRTYVLSIKQRTRADYHYVKYSLSRSLEFLQKSSFGSATKYLTLGILKPISILLPPLPEQRAIAAALSDVDALIVSLDKLITKKRDIKQGAMQQLLTGKIRLPGFSGEWEETSVHKVITSHFSGISPTCKERNIENESEWGVLKTTAVTWERGWDWKKHKVLPRSLWGKEHLQVRKGDVIVTKAGPRHRVGVTACVDYVPPRVCVSGKMIAIRIRQENAVPLMLAAAISAPSAQQYLDQRTTGMAESQVNFENKDLLEVPIKMPCIEEQRAIAAALSDMDAEIAALEARRDKTRAIKQGMMQELLTGRIRLT